jgi:hypothetical protein
MGDQAHVFDAAGVVRHGGQDQILAGAGGVRVVVRDNDCVRYVRVCGRRAWDLVYGLVLAKRLLEMVAVREPGRRYSR